MVVSDDLNAFSPLDRAMAVMKMEAGSLPRLAQSKRIDQMTVVISGEDDQFASSRQFTQKLPGLRRSSAVVHQVADDDQVPRPVIAEERAQPIAHRDHSPHWHQAARGPLTDFVAEMEVGHRQPILPLMEQSEPPVQHDVVRYKCLIWIQ